MYTKTSTGIKKGDSLHFQQVPKMEVKKIEIPIIENYENDTTKTNWGWIIMFIVFPLVAIIIGVISLSLKKNK